MILRAVLEVIDPVRADFWVTIWLGHDLVAVFGQNLRFNLGLSGLKNQNENN